MVIMDGGKQASLLSCCNKRIYGPKGASDEGRFLWDSVNMTEKDKQKLFK